MEGIGKKIALKIEELLSTGGLVKLDKLRADDTVQAVNELCQVHGIGPKKAAELVRDYKIFNLNDLRQRKDLLNHQQEIGLKYFESSLVAPHRLFSELFDAVICLTLFSQQTDSSRSMHKDR